jgi:hypothetical protein
MRWEWEGGAVLSTDDDEAKSTAVPGHMHQSRGATRARTALAHATLATGALCLASEQGGADGTNFDRCSPEGRDGSMSPWADGDRPPFDLSESGIAGESKPASSRRWRTPLSAITTRALSAR